MGPRLREGTPERGLEWRRREEAEQRQLPYRRGLTPAIPIYSAVGLLRLRPSWSSVTVPCCIQTPVDAVAMHSLQYWTAVAAIAACKSSPTRTAKLWAPRVDSC